MRSTTPSGLLASLLLCGGALGLLSYLYATTPEERDGARPHPWIEVGPLPGASAGILCATVGVHDGASWGLTLTIEALEDGAFVPAGAIRAGPYSVCADRLQVAFDGEYLLGRLEDPRARRAGTYRLTYACPCGTAASEPLRIR